MGWIHELVSMHEELESPKSFWFWAGLATLSAVVKDSVWLDRAGAYKLYANIFVMLHADSGMKKGPPVALSKMLVKAVNNTKIISGRSSIQGILKDLGTASTMPGGKLNTKSTGYIVASEFSSSLVSDPAAMTILTDLYDRQYNEGEWRSLLKMETFSLRDPTISMLVATNDTHFDDFIQSKDMKGGFIGRMFLIAETEVQRLNSLIAPLQVKPDRDKLGEYLKQVALAKGPFSPLGSLTESDEYPLSKEGKWFNKAGLLYDDWYEGFYHDFKESGMKDETGSIQRFGDSVLKVAMLLSLSDSTDLIIKEDHILAAIKLGERLIGNVRQTTHGKITKKDSNVDRKETIIRELFNRMPHTITRQQLNQKYWMQGNADEWDECAGSLEVSGHIKIENIGNQIVYRMPEQVCEGLRNYFGGRNKK